jgi:lysophospholipase L1-like esterase
VRRRLFALVPLIVVLGLTEAVGRTRPDPDGAARLYEPDVALVREADGRRETAREELHAQAWTMPASGYRVAFVGDSTVWGQLPAAFGQGLAVPGQAVEVLNFGIRGAASDRARIATRAALEQDLDLLVVYVGHNEVTEARLNPFSLRPFWERSLFATLLHSGTGRLLGGLLDPLRTTPAPDALRAKGDAAPRPLTDAEWAPIAASYRANLTAICAAAAGTPIVFVEPISSLLNPGEAPDEAGPTFRDAVANALFGARDTPAPALAWADELGGPHPDYGPPHAIRGLALLGQGHTAEAVAELHLAREHDAQPARAGERHLAILREVATSCGAPIVATEPGFLADPRYLAPGDPLFMDRVHPTLPGNVLLAGIIAAGAPLPPGSTFDPARVTLTPPVDEAARGWKLPP